MELTDLKGVGAKRAEQLTKAGITTPEKLLRALPRDYLHYERAVPVAEAATGQMALLLVRILEEPRLARFSGKTILSIRAADETGAVTLKWFNQPYRKGTVPVGQAVYAAGRVDRKKGTALCNPVFYPSPPGRLPVYPLCGELTQRTMREAVRRALAARDQILSEELPADILSAFELMPLSTAVAQAHFPASDALLQKAVFRLSFEELLLYLLAVEMQRSEGKREIGFACAVDGAAEAFLSRFPFPPTNAQRRAMNEIACDMAEGAPMNRLLQGDVGSGKTMVAMFALFVAVRNGRQGALMAPTELLARQHYETLSAFFPGVALFTGGMKRAERDKALARLLSGETKIAVGTHALFSGDVRFFDLGLVVTDEQHRFGVRQRARICEKGSAPDVLVMSATPIPRTLALILFADLDLSVLDELPPGRTSVSTSYIPEGRRDDMYEYIASRVRGGAQCYAVCPFIDDSEEMAGMSATTLLAELRKRFPDVSTDLLHGGMKRAARDGAMERFRAGETGILVTTTVIEVGVHVENATIMVIENADRFGLSQLHQLRGRVGRGEKKSYCFLLAPHPGDTAQERIRTMAETTDGFAVAERDLALRGFGELLGYMQHGQGVYALMTGLTNRALMDAARSAAKRVLDEPGAEHNALLQRARRAYLEGAGELSMN